MMKGPLAMHVTKVIWFVLLLTMSFVFIAGAAAGEQNNPETTMTLRASTLGVGLEAGRQMGDYRLRFGAHFFTVNTEQKIGEIDYDIEAKLAYGSVILDWYPQQSGFHLSAGLLYNADDIKARSKDATYYTIAGNLYPMTSTGRLVADVEFPALAPFVGLGWDGSFTKNSKFGWLLEAGAAYLGKNTVYFESDGRPGVPMTDSIWEGELSQEALVIQDYFDKYRILPVVTLGLTYTF